MGRTPGTVDVAHEPFCHPSRLAPFSGITNGIQSLNSLLFSSLAQLRLVLIHLDSDPQLWLSHNSTALRSHQSRATPVGRGVTHLPCRYSAANVTFELQHRACARESLRPSVEVTTQTERSLVESPSRELPPLDDMESLLRRPRFPTGLLLACIVNPGWQLHSFSILCKQPFDRWIGRDICIRPYLQHSLATSCRLNSMKQVRGTRVGPLNKILVF